VIANSQYDMNVIKSWETEGGALPRHPLPALPQAVVHWRQWGTHPIRKRKSPWSRRARFRRAVPERP
jgi:hypothetical protein